MLLFVFLFSASLSISSGAGKLIVSIVVSVRAARSLARSTCLIVIFTNCVVFFSVKAF